MRKFEKIIEKKKRKNSVGFSNEKNSITSHLLKNLIDPKKFIKMKNESAVTKK